MAPVAIALGCVGAAVTIKYVARRIKSYQRFKECQHKSIQTCKATIDGQVVEAVICED